MKIALFTECSSEYGRRLVDGVASYAQKAHDWRLVWINPAAKLVRGAFDGCSGIIARAANDVLARRLARTGLPVVDVFCQREYAGFFGVNSDHETIGRLAAEHFLSKRHTAFAFVGFRNVSFSMKRRRAFTELLERQGHAVEVMEMPLVRDQRAFFNMDARPISGERVLQQWLGKLPRPVAVFAANDLLAVTVSRLAKDADVSVPEEMAILGVDDDRLLCACAETPISSIDPNAFGIGFSAARILAAVLKAPPSQKAHPIHHVAPSGIVERISTERHAVKPQWMADVLGYIDSSLDKPLSTADLVARAGRSHVTVSKMFDELLGMSPVRYITSVKMNAARKMLDNGNILVKEVASQTGYTSVARFCTVYRAFWGHSPRFR